MTTYTVTQQQVDDLTTQANYALAALTSIENQHPSYNLYAIHVQLNTLALMGAYIFSLPMNTFGGNGAASSTDPQSGGTAKGGSF